MNSDPYLAEQKLVNPYSGFKATTVQELFNVLATASRLADEKGDSDMVQLLARVWRPNSPLLHSLQYNGGAIDEVAKNYQQLFSHERRPDCPNPNIV